MKKIIALGVFFIFVSVAVAIAGNPADPLADYRIGNNNRICFKPFYDGSSRGFFASLPIFTNLALTSFNWESKDSKTQYSDLRMICEARGKEITVNGGVGPIIEDSKGETSLSSRVGVEFCYQNFAAGIIVPSAVFSEQAADTKGEIRAAVSKNYGLFASFEEGGGQRYGISGSISSINGATLLQPINWNLAIASEKKKEIFFVRTSQSFETKRVDIIPEVRAEFTGCGDRNYFGGAISFLPKL